ncbi:hypothetical protein X275_09075 [Marinitoga sp. 1197]|uniref:AAA family ATPase n=1 Tax=Marinitoga sp. 1197 TaxID=1428449 RepID=UPI00064168F7|nr:AAA family ATPase [Marinitoga sp. 1197]KLO21513.1 hypothetical protein X275_09075 [Marinitoga sp. 1197]
MKDQKFKKIEIRNYRGIEKLIIDDLADINIIFGSNNSGKTSMLEAIFAHSAGLNLGAFFNVIFPKRQSGNFSGTYDFGENILSLFYNYFEMFKKNNTLRFEIFSTYNNKMENKTFFEFKYSTLLSPFFGEQFEEKNLKVDENVLNKSFFGKMTIDLVNENGNIKKSFNIVLPPQYENAEILKSAVYHDILNHREPLSEVKIYGVLKRFNKLFEFVDKMKEIFPSIKNIDNIPLPDGTSKIYVDIGNEKIPLSLFGDGFRRLYYLLGNMVMYQNSIHLIEEIDSMFHPESIPILAKTLNDYCMEYKNQLFITSHNQEFIEVFLSSLKDKEEILKNNIRVFTLKEYEGKLKILKLNGVEALRNIKEFHLELR